MLRVKVTREATEEEQIFDNIFGGRADLATPGGYEGRAGSRQSMQSNDVGLRV